MTLALWYADLPWWAKLLIGLCSFGIVWLLYGSFKVAVQAIIFFLVILVALTSIIGVGDGVLEAGLLFWRKLADKLASNDGFMSTLKAKANQG